MKADILSRKEQVNTKEDNKDVQLLKEELWQQRITAEITMIKRKTRVEEDDIFKEIRRNTIREKEVIQALKKEDGLPWEEDGVVYMKGRIYVPNNKKIREEILKENHIRHGSHRDESPQNGLGDEQTCGMTLASAYVLHCLSAMWLQL